MDMYGELYLVPVFLTTNGTCYNICHFTNNLNVLSYHNGPEFMKQGPTIITYIFYTSVIHCKVVT